MDVTSGNRAKLTLPADDQILVTREFAAPRQLVFRAWTTPDLVRRWWHAKRGEVTVAEMDLRPGGKWRFVMVTFDGTEVAFHGEVLEVVPNERLVTSEFYEGAPGDPAINTATFTELDGRTTLSLLMQAPSPEVRDMIIASGMEDGLYDALDLLEEIVVEPR